MMLSDLEKAQIMFKLARKGNWGACYDRLEHFKRFQHLDEAIKELENKGWILKHKKEIVDFIEKQIPDLLKGWEK